MASTYHTSGALLLLVIVIVAVKRYCDKLRRFPGPYLASWTDAWRLYYAITSTHKPPLIDVHREYGDIVRIGPKHLSFAQPEAIKDIYGTDKKYPKSNFYWTVAAVARGRPNPTLFSAVDGEWHDNLRRAVNPAFTLSSLVQYEPFVSQTVRTVLQEIEKHHADRPGDSGLLDLPRWMHWYAFDVIGELTYGARYGFMETRSDVDGIIENADFYLNYQSFIGQMPWLDDLLLKNPVLLWLNRRGYFIGKPNPVVTFAAQRQKERSENRRTTYRDDRMDLIDKFLNAKEKNPGVIGDKEILGMGISMVLAASESTAISLTALFYFLLKHPRVYQKLREELEDIERSEDGIVSFQTAYALPYLDACIKETFRLHPAARFSPERVLPLEGAVVAGQRLPGGTVVSMNAWVVHRNESVFGEDVESFIPERWLSDNPERQKQIAEMSRTLFHFGSGRFGCIGKNISLLEMYKLVPSLLLKFDMSLARQEAEWRLEKGTFVNVSNVNVLVKQRGK